ncbi:MAG: zinc ribbon domain-containing protein, partial [SAR202 cluster bacterium]|nr:zinc ribbon domain-containing protein [SAR202 cluster bacterium]
MGRRIHDYRLSGRVKCLKCGRAMVGQTLQGRFRYYRCRRAFAGPRHDRCPSLYVRADHLEQAIKEETARVLANPELIITEAERLSKDGGHRERTEALDRQLRSLNDQRQRLLKLYQLGEIDDDYLRSESQALRSQIG